MALVFVLVVSTLSTPGNAQSAAELSQLVEQMDNGFKKLATTAPPPKLEEIFARAAFDHGVPTPVTTAATYEHRYSEKDVSGFMQNDGLRRDSMSETESVKTPRSIEELLDTRLNTLKSRCFPNLKEEVSIQYVDQLNQTIGVRRSFSGNGFIISIGRPFLNDLNKKVFELATALFINFRRQHTGFATEGRKMSDFATVGEFVDLATQLNSQNLAPKTYVESGGAPKRDFTIIMAQLSTVPALDSPNIPSAIKKQMLSSEGFAANALDIEVGDASADPEAYHNQYITALYFYVLRDILTYLLGHELGHVEAAKLQESRGVLAEIGADEAAVRSINLLKDTDPHSLILAMAAFHQRLLASHDEDPDHPFTPQRLDILYHALGNQNQNLFLAVDTGENLLRTEVHTKQLPGISHLEVSYSLRHVLRFHITFDPGDLKESPTAVFETPTSLFLETDVRLSHIDRSGRAESEGHFVGEVILENRVQNYLRAGKGSVTAVAELALPAELWAECLDCVVQVTKLSVLPSGAKGNGWIIEAKSVESLIAAFKSVASWRQPYELLFLARDMYRRHRVADAGHVYGLVRNHRPDLLAPADWLRWASTLTDITKQIEVMDTATNAFPKTQELHYVDAVVNERDGRLIKALDEYFYEIYGVQDSTLDKDANLQMIKIMAESRDGTPESKYFEGMKYYIAAEQLGSSDGSGVLYSKAAERFHEVASMMGSFSARVYEAETNMYGCVLTVGKPARFSLPKQLFLGLIQVDPLFMPSYAHMFDIAVCEGNIEDAKHWLVEAIKKNPAQIHDMIRIRLGALDQNQLEGACDLSNTH